MAFIKSVDTPVPTLLTYRDLSVTSPETNGMGPKGQVSSLAAIHRLEGACRHLVLLVLPLDFVWHVETVFSPVRLCVYVCVRKSNLVVCTTKERVVSLRMFNWHVEK